MKSEVYLSHRNGERFAQVIGEKKMSNTFVIESGEMVIDVSVICHDSYDGFDEQWKGTDKHQGGVTVKNPAADRNSWKYFIPQQTSISEVTAAYVAQGRYNASGNAYQSLQEQLERDIHACDYGFNVSVSVCGVELVDSVPIGCGFDHSEMDEDDLITAARRVWDEYGTTEEAVTLAKDAVKEIIKCILVLTAFAQ
jgi:hypothetical protein